MKVPDYGVPTQQSDGDQQPSRMQMLMAAAMMAKGEKLAPDEALGLKGANADAARWRR